MRRCLLSRVAGADPLTGLLSAAQAVVAGRRQPVGQDGEGLPARLTNRAARPDAFVLVVVRLAESPPVADDRVVVTNRAQSRQELQRDYPGSLLSFVSGSAIKRITAGVKARR